MIGRRGSAAQDVCWFGELFYLFETSKENAVKSCSPRKGARAAGGTGSARPRCNRRRSGIRTTEADRVRVPGPSPPSQTTFNGIVPAQSHSQAPSARIGSNPGRLYRKT
jgi:hypothetical protein